MEIKVSFCWNISLHSQCTMLQKLSKCEVKAWLCWNLMILPPLWFYVKSHNGKFKRSKNVIDSNFRNAELLILVNLGLESCSNVLNRKIRNLWSCQKQHFWTVWIHQNLISRKIGVAVKLSNFNNVKP